MRRPSDGVYGRVHCYGPWGFPADSEGLVVPVDESGDGGGMTLDELLAEIGAEGPVLLPKPAAVYLAAARNANET